MLRYRLALPWLWLLRATRLLRRAPHGFRTLLFHHVPPERHETFARFVDHVAGVTDILTPAEAETWICSGCPPMRLRPGRVPVLFTFDDGFASNYRVALETLSARGVQAVFFVCPGLMDHPLERQRDAIAAGIFDGRVDGAALPPDLRLMSWNEVLDLRARGHAIGSHGLSHRRLSLLEDEALRAEIHGAADRLQEVLGQAPLWYAHAFGDVGSVSALALREIGGRHLLCRSGVRGLNDMGTPRLALRADQIDLDAPSAYRQGVLEGGLDSRYREARSRLDQLAGASVP